MSEQKTYTRKAGDLTVFTSTNRTKDSQPLLWGKLVIDPKQLLEELQKNPTEDGLLELRVSLWGYQGKNNSRYWSGNAKLQEETRKQVEDLPPSEAPVIVPEQPGFMQAQSTDADNVAPGPGFAGNDLPF
jgi:hypothetical protein